MEWNENEKKIIDKAEFYKSNEICCHVPVIPKPKFKNGLFVSKINIDPSGQHFFWFIEKETSIPIRLFLFEIYDILDYIEKEEEK